MNPIEIIELLARLGRMFGLDLVSAATILAPELRAEEPTDPGAAIMRARALRLLRSPAAVEASMRLHGALFELARAPAAASRARELTSATIDAAVALAQALDEGTGPCAACGTRTREGQCLACDGGRT